MSITIGPLHIADANGTHEPNAVINEPSEALIALADAKTCDPATGLPYAFYTPSAEPVHAPVTEPEPTPVAEATSAEEAA